MKITFNKDDFLKFFNMISVYKVYAEVAEKVDIEPPISAIDLLLHKLTSLIIENNWYKTDIKDINVCFGIIQFMLGTAKLQIDNDISSTFGVYGQLTFDTEKLWNYLIENGIEI